MLRQIFFKASMIKFLIDLSFCFSLFLLSGYNFYIFDTISCCCNRIMRLLADSSYLKRRYFKVSLIKKNIVWTLEIFYLHFNSHYPKLMISERYFPESRNFTLRYHYFGMNLDLAILRANCICLANTQSLTERWV